MYSCVHTYLRIYKYIYTYVYVYIYVYISTCIYTYIFVYIYIYIYVYVYISLTKSNVFPNAGAQRHNGVYVNHTYLHIHMNVYIDWYAQL